MSGRTLTLRRLNRAILARQMLLERETLSAHDAVGRLAGLQAQVPNPPYIGLWTRLKGFRREDLTRELEARRVFRTAMMRSTLHLVMADDLSDLRPSLQPALDRALNAFFGRRAKELDIEKLIYAAWPFLEEAPRTTGELKRRLSEVQPEGDPYALAYAVRNNLPLVQVPPGGSWGGGSRAAYTIAGVSGGAGGLRTLLLRYLAAFGPATVMDFQAWSGLVRLKPAVEDIKPELRVFRDEEGRELLDVPDAPLPPPDTPAPPRFLPEYDNLLLSHADRSRVISGGRRDRVFLSAGRVRATFLVDGFLAGTWRAERQRGVATLVAEPFIPLPKEARDPLISEAVRLVRFVEDGAEAFEVRVEEP